MQKKKPQRLTRVAKNKHILVVDPAPDDSTPSSSAPGWSITDQTLLTLYKGTDASDRNGITDYGDLINDHRQGWSLWPNGSEIFYVFDPDLGNCERSTIAVATDVIESSNSNIRFSELSSVEAADAQQPIAIHITGTGEGCFASLGYRASSENVLNLGAGCVNVGTAIHLLMHALGVFHEHQRPDRDNFVQIVTTNIDQSRMGGNVGTTKFESVFSATSVSASAWSSAVVQLDYDYGSIMHNGPCHYSVDEAYGGGSGGCSARSTLIASASPGVSNYVNTADAIGNRATLSARDVALLAILYPSSSSPSVSTSPVAVTGETTLCTVADAASFEWSVVPPAAVNPKTLLAEPAAAVANPNELAMFSNFFSDPANDATIYTVSGIVGGIILVAILGFFAYKTHKRRNRSGFKAAIEESEGSASGLLGSASAPEDPKETGDSTDSEVYADIIEGPLLGFERENPSSHSQSAVIDEKGPVV